MENKVYEIQGQRFKLLPNDLSLLNKAAPMIARLRRLSYEYTKDIDLSKVNEYNARITELTEAKIQLEELLSSGKNENGAELTEEKKTDLKIKINEFSDKIDFASDEFRDNTSLQNLLKLKQELEGYALIELLTDIDFLIPILKKILTGGNVETLNFSDTVIISFVRDVITDFFTVMNRNSLKL